MFCCTRRCARTSCFCTSNKIILHSFIKAIAVVGMFNGAFTSIFDSTP
uniref:Uncharacterized protein n=1 Tax=Parascaris equorum TaxID=6256 RepID=A0A914S4F4_PAREQ